MAGLSPVSASRGLYPCDARVRFQDALPGCGGMFISLWGGSGFAVLPPPLWAAVVDVRPVVRGVFRRRVCDCRDWRSVWRSLPVAGPVGGVSIGKEDLV